MKKMILILGLAISAFAVGYGVVSQAYPWPWPYDRNEYHGYWENRYDDAGKYVLGASCSGSFNYWNGQDNCNAIPNYVDTAGEFSAFIIDRYNNGSSTDRVGAAFIILSMIGNSRSWPVSGGEQQEFINRVNALAPYTLWNSTSFVYNLNSYNQRGTNGVGPNDIALYDDNASGHRAIVFRNSSGGVEYVIKTRCANPIGFNTIDPLPDDLNFNMSATATVNNRTPSAGQTIRFDYTVTNNGPTATDPHSIWWAANDTVNGGQTIPGHPTGTYWVGRTDQQSETYIIPNNTPPGTRICRQVDVHPGNAAFEHRYSNEECAVVQYNFTLTPTVTAVVTSGGVPITGSVAEPGDTITFTYAVNNGGSTESQSITCTYRQATYPGNNETPPTTLFTPAGSNCPPPRTFPRLSNTTTATEVVTASTINTSICRSLTVTPSTHNGGTAVGQDCVQVGGKPYTRVWGGDISAGNGLANASGVCSTNNDAAIVGWNKRPVGSSAGAGVQFAAFAMKRITDFASALYDPGGATSPDGLSFSNTTTVPASGNFGGDFGAASCIPDYYATRPATTSAIPPTVAGMVTGVYGGSGNITLGGGSIVNPNNRITVYVDGNVYINGNITYSGSWNTTSTPLFELIVRGNIYIDNDVTQLDGVYVAQANATPNTGQILTCATGFSELALNSLYATCARKLTVNGLFTANRIQLLRTIGTLSQSNTSEASTAPSIAEVFNYGPAVWIKQPVRQTDAPTPPYDAIISLPPIL